MKKLSSLALVSLMALSLLLTGCDERPDSSSSPSPSIDITSPSPSVSSTPTPASSGGFSVDLTEGEYEAGGERGYIGDVLHTYWFNFAVDEAYTCASYGSYTAPEGTQLLVVHIGLKSTATSSVEMYDTDFMVEWNDDASDAFAFPLTTDPYADSQVEIEELLSDEQLPAVYDLPINGEEEGDLVFQVPLEDPDGNPNRDFYLSFEEIFASDDVEGDLYFVLFTAEER